MRLSKISTLLFSVAAFSSVGASKRSARRREDDGPALRLLQDFKSGDVLPMPKVNHIIDISIKDDDMDRRTMTKEDILDTLDEKRASSGGNNRHARGRHLQGNKMDVHESSSGAVPGTNQRRTRRKSKDETNKPEASPQVVFLNFPGNEFFVVYDYFYNGYYGFPAYSYTQSDREEIQARVETMYEGYNIEFTQTQPSDEAEFSTLTFECEHGSCMDFYNYTWVSILFGAAEHIDFHNRERSDNAFVQAEFWQYLYLIDPSDMNLKHYSDVFNTPNITREEAYSTVIIRQAARTAAHELGHLLGLRHHDSFGPPGAGITPYVPSYDFYPTFEGLDDADETFLHVMASGASVGRPLFIEVDKISFFGERSMVKLLSNEEGVILQEADVGGLKKNIKFQKIKTDITIPEGENANMKLDIQEVLIHGTIDTAGETDFYRFDGKAGDVVSAEFNGFDIFFQSYYGYDHDYVIGALNLYRENTDGTWTLVAQNHQSFEGFDPLMIDALLETDGTYIMEVFAPDLIYFGPSDALSLDLTGNADLRLGDYYVSIYKTAGKS